MASRTSSCSTQQQPRQAGVLPPLPGVEMAGELSCGHAMIGWRHSGFPGWEWILFVENYSSPELRPKVAGGGGDYPTSAYCRALTPSSEVSGAGRCQRWDTELGEP